VFIALEGIHGAGKSVLASALRELLECDDIPVIIARDQVGTALSTRIREINVGLDEDVDEFVESFLVAAARRQTFVEIIRPALAEGHHVIAERFTDAFFAFGDARGQPKEFLDILEHYTSEGRQPDLTILLDLPADVAINRIDPDERHRVERSDIAFHNMLREAYLVRARINAARFAIIDASLPPADVIQLAVSVIRRFPLEQDVI